jgi:ABC-type transport system substrate-binding protein
MSRLLAAVVLLGLGWGVGWSLDPAGAQETPTPRGEIRVVNLHRNNWAWVTFNVFEHLIEMDRDGNLVPRLATSWEWLDERTLEVRLRQGVRFHNGEVFDAEIVKLNWKENSRRRQPHVMGQYLNFKPGSRVDVIDRYAVRFVFPEPDGGALAKLMLMHMGNRQFYRQLGWGEEHW